MKTEKTITKSGREFSTSVLKEELKWALPLSWSLDIWKPKDALKSVVGDDSREYIGQPFDANHFEIIKGAAREQQD